MREGRKEKERRREPGVHPRQTLQTTFCFLDQTKGKRKGGYLLIFFSFFGNPIHGQFLWVTQSQAPKLSEGHGLIGCGICPLAHLLPPPPALLCSALSLLSTVSESLLQLLHLLLHASFRFSACRSCLSLSGVSHCSTYFFIPVFTFWLVFCLYWCSLSNFHLSLFYFIYVYSLIRKFYLSFTSTLGSVKVLSKPSCSFFFLSICSLPFWFETVFWTLA